MLRIKFLPFKIGIILCKMAAYSFFKIDGLAYINDLVLIVMKIINSGF